MTVAVETKTCSICEKRSILRVDAASYQLWQSGMLVQDAFPNMDHATREMFISGTHPECWNSMFNNGE